MNRTAIAALVIAALVFWPRRGAAETDPATGDTAPIQPQARNNPDAVPSDYPDEYFPVDKVRAMGFPIDVNAFLYMIRSSEHRFPTDVVNGACYQIFYGGKRFNDLSDHPVITGELAPVPLPDHMCRAAGLNPPCFTTAAGGYQFIRPTWQRLRDRLGLEDFSPASQDAAAVELLREVGALDLIEQGDIEGAMKKASKAWASLPGNQYQQNPRAPQFAFARFAEGQRLFA